RRPGWANNRLVPPTSPLWGWLGWSRLFLTLAMREVPSSRRTPLSIEPELRSRLPFASVSRTAEPSPGDPMGRTLALLEFFRSYLESKGVPWLVLVVPSAHLYMGSDSGESEFRLAILRWLEERRVPAIDYFARTEGYRSDWRKLYLNENEHWTPLGNR